VDDERPLLLICIAENLADVRHQSALMAVTIDAYMEYREAFSAFKKKINDPEALHLSFSPKIATIFRASIENS
jgi:hypothetical protein